MVVQRKKGRVAVIIDIVSDLHGHFPTLEDGDLLIVCGDLTARDEDLEYIAFEEWFEVQPYRRKIIIGGNHDNFLVKYGHNLFLATEESQPQYLCDSGIEFEGLKIWGSPWTLTFPGMNPRCKAFTVDTEEELADKFGMIPDNIDILITHGPPYGILDAVLDVWSGTVRHTGSNALLNVLDRLQPRLNAFGHIHEQGGKQMLYKHSGPNTICVNASIVDERYIPTHKPVRIIL